MKINLKQLLNEEFEKITPDMDKGLKNTPISQIEGKKPISRRLMFRLAMVATVLVFGVSLFCVTYFGFGAKSKSGVTCVLACDVQIVVENDKVIDVGGLNPGSVNKLDSLDYDGLELVDLLSLIIENSANDGTVTVEVVNNKLSVAKSYIEKINSSNINSKVSAKSISVSEYSLKVFGKTNIIDNLDEDKSLIIAR